MLMYDREAQQKTGTDSRPALFRKIKATLSYKIPICLPIVYYILCENEVEGNKRLVYN